MFTKVYYDSYNHKMYHWYNKDGKQYKEIVPLKYKYYIEDKTGNSEIKDIYGVPVIEKFADNRDGFNSVINSGVKTWETDIQQDILFLQDRWKNIKLEVNIDCFNIAIVDIELASKDSFKPSEAKFPINLISVYFSKTKQLYSFGLKEYTGDSDIIKNYHYCENEKLLLERFVDCFRKNNPDIITGWYSDVFDIPYLIKRMEMLNIERSLSSINIVIKHKNNEEYTIGGVAILDYLKLYKKFSYTNLESYSLGYVGKHVVGEGKLEFEGQISDLYERDWNKFVEYNIQDILLVKKIDEKLKFIELIITLSYQALIPFDKVFSPIAVYTGYIMKFLHKKNLVMPCRNKSNKSEEFEGAYVFANPGKYEYIMSFDFESLYPHILMQKNISIETLRIIEKKYKLIVNNNDEYYNENDEIYIKRNNNIIKIKIKELTEEDEIYR